jgi:hypothetical protein
MEPLLVLVEFGFTEEGEKKFLQPGLAQRATTASVMPCQSLKLSMLIERCKQVKLRYMECRDWMALFISDECTNLL